MVRIMPAPEITEEERARIKSNVDRILWEMIEIIERRKTNEQFTSNI